RGEKRSGAHPAPPSTRPAVSRSMVRATCSGEWSRCASQRVSSALDRARRASASSAFAYVARHAGSSALIGRSAHAGQERDRAGREEGGKVGGSEGGGGGGYETRGEAG